MHACCKSYSGEGHSGTILLLSVEKRHLGIFDWVYKATNHVKLLDLLTGASTVVNNKLAD